MPTIATVGGIDINVYNGDHNPPHIHAVYNDYEVRININTGSRLRGGDMPNAPMRRIKLWLEENRENALKIFQALNPNLRQ